MRVRRVWSTVVVAAALLGFAGCGSDNNYGSDGASDSTAAVVGSTPQDAGDTTPAGDSSSGGGAAGTWHLSQQTFDENSNYQLDPEELATATGPEYGILTIEINDDGTCTFTGKSEQGVGTCQLGSCDDLSVGNVDCEVLDVTGGRILAIEPGPSSATTLGGRYGVLALADDQLVLKDMTGAQGTIYVYKPA